MEELSENNKNKEETGNENVGMPRRKHRNYNNVPVGQEYTNKKGETKIRKYANWAEKWSSIPVGKTTKPIQNLYKLTPENIKERYRRAQETKAKNLHYSKFVEVLRPFYEGITCSKLSKTEIRNLFVASFYVMVEVTKEHRVLIPEIGMLTSRKTYRPTKFRYRFTMRPTKQFKAICDNTNLFTTLPCIFQRDQEPILDNAGKELLNFKWLVENGNVVTNKTKKIKVRSPYKKDGELRKYGKK